VRLPTRRWGNGRCRNRLVEHGAVRGILEPANAPDARFGARRDAAGQYQFVVRATVESASIVSTARRIDSTASSVIVVR
jgi:hypothetical protein